MKQGVSVTIQKAGFKVTENENQMRKSINWNGLKRYKHEERDIRLNFFLPVQAVSAFDIADSIVCVLNEYQGNKFDELRIYAEFNECCNCQ